MLAFDAEVYAALLAQYGAKIWPLQLATVLLGLGALFLIRLGGFWSGRAIGGFLAAVWAWCGIHFHAGHFASVNFVAPVVGAAFVLQAVLLAISGFFRGRVDPRFRRDVCGWIGLGLVLFGLVGYPILGLPPCEGLTGVPGYKAAPSLPTTGVAAALVTLGMLALMSRAPWHLALIPLVWLVIAGIAAWHLELVEALPLMTSAALAFCTILWNNHGRRWFRHRLPSRSGRSP